MYLTKCRFKYSVKFIRIIITVNQKIYFKNQFKTDKSILFCFQVSVIVTNLIVSVLNPQPGSGWWAASGCEAMVPESYLCRPLGPGVTCTCDRAGATLGCVQEARTQELGWPHWSTTEAILAVTLVLMLVFAAIRCVSI